MPAGAHGQPAGAHSAKARWTVRLIIAAIVFFSYGKAYLENPKRLERGEIPHPWQVLCFFSLVPFFVSFLPRCSNAIRFAYLFSAILIVLTAVLLLNRPTYSSCAVIVTSSGAPPQRGYPASHTQNALGRRSRGSGLSVADFKLGLNEDARLMRELFAQRQIEVISELGISADSRDPTRSSLQHAFRKLFAQQSDSFVIYYSGHGYRPTGNWILHPSITDQEELSLEDILNIWEDRPSHVDDQELLILMDSCHAGSWVDAVEARRPPGVTIVGSAAVTEESVGSALGGWFTRVYSTAHHDPVNPAVSLLRILQVWQAQLSHQLRHLFPFSPGPYRLSFKTWYDVIKESREERRDRMEDEEAFYNFSTGFKVTDVKEFKYGPKVTARAQLVGRFGKGLRLPASWDDVTRRARCSNLVWEWTDLDSDSIQRFKRLFV